MFTVVLTAIAVYFGAAGRVDVMFAALAGGAALLLATILAPRWLRAPNAAWLWLGVMIGKVTNPIFMGAIYFCLFAPIGLLFRLIGRDELGIRRPRADTYWTDWDARFTEDDDYFNRRF